MWFYCDSICTSRCHQWHKIHFFNFIEVLIPSVIQGLACRFAKRLDKLLTGSCLLTILLISVLFKKDICSVDWNRFFQSGRNNIDKKFSTFYNSPENTEKSRTILRVIRVRSLAVLIKQNWAKWSLISDITLSLNEKSSGLLTKIL